MALSLAAKKCYINKSRLYLSKFHEFSKLFSSTCTSQRKGLVLGAYYDDEAKCVELTPAADKFNLTAQGRLIEQINLSVFSSSPHHHNRF